MEQSDDDEDSDFVLVHEDVPQPTSSRVLSSFAPAFKNVPEPPEEPTIEHAALIENPCQEHARNTSSLTNSRPTFKQFWKSSIG